MLPLDIALRDRDEIRAEENAVNALDGSTAPQWQQLALYSVAAALVIMLLQRIPVVGRIIRFAISLALFAFLIFILLQQAPYQPELSRLTSSLGLDDQKVAGKELRVKMAGRAFLGDRLDQ